MEPEVRFCTTEDGLRIAYTVTGSGPPIVLRVDQMVSHVQLEWAQNPFRRAMERICRTNTLIRFDPRGAGMSDRVYATGFEESVLDIEALVDRLQLDEFALAALQTSSIGIIPYAARYPQRVRRIIFIDGFLRNADLLNTPQARAIVTAAASDFELATEMIGAAVFGTGRNEIVNWGAYIRSCIAQDYFAYGARTISDDATPYASALIMPALVIRHDGLQYITADMTRDLVARLPNARLVVLPGLWADSPERLGENVAAFVNDQEITERDPKSSAPRSGVLTVLFTDIVGHTEMMQRLGDAKGREVLREHERITRETLKQHGGAEVKTMGDGFMASFGFVTAAMDCAVALQRAFAAQNESMPEPLHVRVGLNAGEPIEEDGDLFGSTVILASRIAAEARAGEILVPEPLRHLLSGKSYVYADRGETMLKGFEEAVRLYEVRWQV